LHYFSFNIPDYRAKTSHLSDDEDLAYRRLTEEYYLEESALPNDVEKLSRKIRMPSKISAVESVLKEFFFLGEDGLWHKNRCDNAIASYKKLQKSGKIGGKKRVKNQTLAKGTLTDPCITLQATNNQEPITKKESKKETPTSPTSEGILPFKKESKKFDVEKIPLPDWLPSETWIDFCRHRVFLKKPMSERAAKLALMQLSKFKAKGKNPIDIINQSIMRGWAGLFEIKENFQNKQFAPASTKRTYSDDLRDAADSANRNLERKSENGIY